MPNTRTIASNTVVDLWAALVSQRLEQGEPLGVVLPGIGATIARFSQLRRNANRETARTVRR